MSAAYSDAQSAVYGDVHQVTPDNTQLITVLVVGFIAVIAAIILLKK